MADDDGKLMVVKHNLQNAAIKNKPENYLKITEITVLFNTEATNLVVKI